MKKKSPPDAMVRRPPGGITHLDAPLLTRGPLASYLGSLHSDKSKATMRERLDVAAGLLEPGRNAETFMWEGLDHQAVGRVLGELRKQITKAGDPMAPSTVNLTRAALRGVAGALFDLRLLDSEELERIRRVKRDRGVRPLRGRALDAKEIRKLFKACERDETPAGRRDAALLACMFGAGLRRSAVSRLNLGDYRDGLLYVKEKGDNWIPRNIGPDAGAAIEAWVQVRGDAPGPLFHSIDKIGRINRRRLAPPGVGSALKRMAKRASIDKTTPHDLRRTFVSMLLEMGEDLSTVSKAAGHSSVAVTAGYDRRDGKRVAQAVGRLVVPFGRKTP